MACSRHLARKSGENRWSFSHCTLVCTEAVPFLQRKPIFLYGAKLIFRSFATFFGLTIALFDQVPNKDFGLLASGQFETRLQEFGLWTS